MRLWQIDNEIQTHARTDSRGIHRHPRVRVLQMNGYAMVGRIIMHEQLGFPMPKWVNYRPIQSGIRYNLEAMKTKRRDNKARTKRKKREV